MNWSELAQSGTRNVLAWAEKQPWAAAMAACQQEPEWHAEGDVWTHTNMVCGQLSQLAEWPTLTPQEQIVLLFTALLHDAGKPKTSQIDPATGRIRSPKHAAWGEKLARSVLRELACDLATREEIARMVRYHGRPAFLLEKESPQHEVISLSWLVNNKLLYLFAIADARGRTTGSTARPEENLHLWKLVAEECHCFEQPYPFANEQARFLFYRQSDFDLHYVPHESFGATVTMMSGLPGSGKDTWLARNRNNLPMVSLDAVRDELDVDATDNQGQVIPLAQDRCRELLRSKQSFAFNATNLLRQTRQRWIELFVDYGARIEIVYVEPSWAEIRTQNQRRQHPVPEKVIRELASKCEPPTWAEAHKCQLVDRER